MKYLKVKKEYDQYRLNGCMGIHIADELYTLKEVERYGVKTEYCEEVEISRKKTYFFFGARFEKM